jgi:hypothetical protein
MQVLVKQRKDIILSGILIKYVNINYILREDRIFFKLIKLREENYF